MKIEIPKPWIEKKAILEEGLPIEAGSYPFECAAKLTREQWIAEAQKIAVEEYKWTTQGIDGYCESLYDEYANDEVGYSPREALEEDCSYGI